MYEHHMAPIFQRKNSCYEQYTEKWAIFLGSIKDKITIQYIERVASDLNITIQIAFSTKIHHKLNTLHLIKHITIHVLAILLHQLLASVLIGPSK